MTDITILSTTWLPPGLEEQRLKAFEKAWRSWERHLRIPGRINLIVSDDGTEQEWFAKLYDSALRWKRGEVVFTQQKRRGLGASLNVGLRTAFLRYPDTAILHAVDDWELLTDLNLVPWLNFLNDPKYDVGMIRFFGHPDLTGTIRHVPPHGWAIALDRHHYIFSFRPCIWKEEFFKAFGYFEEGKSALEIEHEFNNRIISREPIIEGERIWLALPEQWRPIETVSLSDITPEEING